MRNKLIATATLVCSALAVAAAPMTADAASRHRVRVCTRHSSHHRTTGTVVGAVGGGLLGNALSHGGTGGTLVGVGAGAVAGHELAKKKCHYEYRYY